MKAMDRIHKHRGAAAVEFAILLIPLVVMAVGMTEIGRTLYYYNGLLSSTRSAARYLGTVAPGEGEAAARCIAVHGNPGCSGPALVPGLTTAMVHIGYEHIADDPEVDTDVALDLVRVTVEGYPFASLVPMVVADMTFAPIGCTMRQAAA
jgi:TadE-like protein